MGRVLLVFEAWERHSKSPLDVERAMLIDFALQHPRSIGTIMPAVVPVIRAHGLGKQDLGDLFAKRHYGSMRERFLGVLADLLARDLLKEHPATSEDDPTRLSLSESGRTIASSFSTGLSIGLRSVGSVICESWSKKNVQSLTKEIRHALPDESELISALGLPFAEWLTEVE